MSDRRNRRWGMGELVLTGGALGLLLAVMKLMEFSFLTRDLTLEAYLAGIALLFLLIGAALARRYFPARSGASTGAGHSTDVSARATGPVEESSVPMEGEGRGVVRSAPWGELSDREVEVLELVARGKTNREIADELYLSPNTIKSHVSNIYRKLDVARRPEAVARAKELAILQ